MYDFVCEHIVPGCKHRDHHEEKVDLIERSVAHLREHHDLGHDREAIGRTLEQTGAVFIRPA